MATIYTTAAEAIEASASSNRTTHCERTEQNFDTLLVECDSGSDGDESEFWGMTDDGHLWRVHCAAA